MGTEFLFGVIKTFGNSRIIHSVKVIDATELYIEKLNNDIY